MRKALVALVVLLSACFMFPATKVAAKVITNRKGTVTVAKSEVVNDDLFVGARTVQLDGTVNGDVFIAGQIVTITGVINGNLHVGAGTLDLGGTVKGNVYAGAQNVLVNTSSIGGSLLAAGENVNLDKDTSIGGSVLAGAGTLSVDAQIKRSVYAATGSLTIGSDAKIGKDVYYVSGKNGEQAYVSSNAKIAGVIKKTEINATPSGTMVAATKKQIQAVFAGIKFASTFISLFGALIVGFLYWKLFNKHFTQSARSISGSFWKTFGIGFLASIAFIPGLIILLITVIGLPVAGLAILLFILYWYLAKIVVGSALGNWITQKYKWKTSVYGSFALGLLVIYILKMIPVIGSLVGLAVFWIGLGALTIQMFSTSN